jgi:hypothetical protein
VEPLTTSAEPTRALDSSATVIARRRLGVSHAKWWAARNERVPVAAAPNPIADIMHCTHMS